MISKLKLRCGAQYTSKMEGMISDLQVGSEHNRTFCEHLRTADSDSVPSLNFSILVLTTGFWPPYKSPACPFPPQMQELMTQFSQYYHGATSHRKLSWVSTLGTAFVSANFKRTYELQVTTLQAITLHLFNTSPEVRTRL